jgi:hypothetical protein
MHPRTTIGMDEPMRSEEAGERLRAYIREVQELDGQVEAINSRKRWASPIAFAMSAKNVSRGLGPALRAFVVSCLPKHSNNLTLQVVSCRKIGLMHGRR